jgi:hypothetical protein
MQFPTVEIFHPLEDFAITAMMGITLQQKMMGRKLVYSSKRTVEVTSIFWGTAAIK